MVDQTEKCSQDTCLIPVTFDRCLIKNFDLLFIKEIRKMKNIFCLALAAENTYDMKFFDEFCVKTSIYTRLVNMLQTIGY